MNKNKYYDKQTVKTFPKKKKIYFKKIRVKNIGLRYTRVKHDIDMTQFNVFFSVIFKSYHEHIITTKQNLYSIRSSSYHPFKQGDKWNNSISRGSARRKYNAVNLIYRINHDLLCNPESAVKFHQKPSYSKAL